MRDRDVDIAGCLQDLQVDKPRTVWKVHVEACGGGPCEACLPDPAGTGNREQPDGVSE
jgi:hypothetical protein